MTGRPLQSEPSAARVASLGALCDALMRALHVALGPSMPSWRAVANGASLVPQTVCLMFARYLHRGCTVGVCFSWHPLPHPPLQLLSNAPSIEPPMWVRGAVITGLVIFGTICYLAIQHASVTVLSLLRAPCWELLGYSITRII